MNFKITTAEALEWKEGQMLIDALIEQKRYQIALFIATGLYTGLRYSDLIRLKYCDLSNDKILIQEKKTQNTSKKRKYREITLSEDFKKIINKCLPTKDKSWENQFIFINKKGSPYTIQWSNLLLKQLKNEFTFISCENFSNHSLRKGFGKRVWEIYNKSSEGLIMLQEIFNHSSPEITLRYLGIRREDIANIYKSL